MKVLELVGSDVTLNYIICPADPTKELGIKLQNFSMIIKPVTSFLVSFLNSKFSGFDFSFEIQALDNRNTRRRFRMSTFQVCGTSACKLILKRRKLKYPIKFASFP